jgi:hypothetical protein
MRRRVKFANVRDFSEPAITQHMPNLIIRSLNYALDGQGLVFERNYLRAVFSFDGFTVPIGESVEATFDWTIGTRSVRMNERSTSSMDLPLTPLDVGQTISVTATVTYKGEKYTATSSPMTVLNVNAPASGSVQVEGDQSRAGNVLSAVTDIRDEDGVGALSYQWFANGAVMAGATGQTLTLGAAEAGKDIAVTVSYVDGYGNAESFGSKDALKPWHQNKPGLLQVSGELAAGQTLRADVADPDHQGKMYYQWQVGDGKGNFRNVDGAWNRDFAIGAEAPATVRVFVTYADDFGAVELYGVALGTGGDDHLTLDQAATTTMAGDGDDMIYGHFWPSGGRVVGGAGLDTLVSARPRDSFTKLEEVDEPWILWPDQSGQWQKWPTHPGQWYVGVGMLSSIGYQIRDVERVHFALGDRAEGDGIALDYHGHAGQAYRLYNAAFDRTPDKIGQGFWMNRLDIGVSLTEIANAFVASSEFKQLYGANPTNAEIVAKFYQNVLGRAPDPQNQFWVDALDSKRATVAEVLVGFSESAENIAALIGVADTGIDFTPYTGG